MRVLFGLMLVAIMAIGTNAQEAERPWEATVTGQILAFRSGDASAVLGFAGSTFQRTFQDAERFAAAIDSMGYGPIIQSRSHSFAAFRQTAPDSVVQGVNLVGPDGSLYEAIYQLVNEPELGWRVHGVVMRKSAGLST